MTERSGGAPAHDMPEISPPLRFSLRPRRASPTAGREAIRSTSYPTSAQNEIPPPESLGAAGSTGRKRLSLTRRTPPPNKISTNDAALQTRAELRAYTRTDWTFPEPPELTRFRRTAPDTVYTERELELSASSRSATASPVLPHQSPTGGINRLSKDINMDHKEAQSGTGYRFESPEDVGDAVKKRRSRWQRLARQEQTWNEGLRHWQRQRDAWTGAVKVRKSDSPRVVYHRDLVEEPSSIARHPERRVSLDSGSSFASAQSSPSSPDTASRSLPNAASTSRPRRRRSSASSGSTTNSTDSLNYATLVPLAPPLVAPDHPIRSQIHPRSYRSIYTKIVAQGSAPSIPVNLRDIVSACVTGWKADGEWPPKSSYPEPLQPTPNGLGHLPTLGGVTIVPKIESHRKAKIRSRIGSMVGNQELSPTSPTSPIKSEGVDRMLAQENSDTKTLGMVGRSVKRVSRALKLVGDAFLDNDEYGAAEDDGLDVPGLVQEQDEAISKLKTQGLI